MMSYEWYITPEEYEIAKKNGISELLLSRRIRLHGWSKERAMSEPVQSKHKIPKEVKEIAKKNGISYDLLRLRLSKGWSYEKASSEPKLTNFERGKQLGDRSRKYDKKYLELAKENGISESTFRYRVKELGMTQKEAANIPVMNRKQIATLGAIAHKEKYGYNFGSGAFLTNK